MSIRSGWYEVLGATAPSVTVAPAVALVRSDAQPLSTPRIVAGLAGNTVGAIAGWKLWQKHRWLGLFTGAAVGGGTVSLVSGPSKSHALVTLGSAGAAVGLSKAWRKHPIAGWLIGGLVGSIAGTLIAKRVNK